MDDLILSDKILTHQVCAECLNYLSVGPVRVTRAGNIICGRCSPFKLSVLNHSLYNLVAEKLVFRCINCYEGCEELLNFNEAVEHEENCKAVGFKCPFCDYEGNGCQLVHHFHQKHPWYVAKEETFEVVIKERFSRNLVFVKKNYIFSLSISVGDTFIKIFILLISPAHLGPKHYKLRFFNSNTNVEFVTFPIQVTHNSSSSLPRNNSDQITDPFLLEQTSLLEYFPSGSCLCKVELIDSNPCDVELKNLTINYLEKNQRKIKLPTDIVAVVNADKSSFDLNRVLKMSRSDLRKFIWNQLRSLQYCVNCKKYITSVVYFCPKYHMACKDCATRKCLKCDTLCLWNIKPKLNIISLPCEWSGCSSCPNMFNCITHKRDCPMRPYKCPDVDCEFEGCFVQLKKHWHLNPISQCNQLVIRYESQSLFWYVSNYHEIFYVSVDESADPPQRRKFSLTITQVDIVMFKSYEFQIAYWTGSYYNHEVMKKICPEEGNNVAVFDISNISITLPLKVSCSLK